MLFMAPEGEGEQKLHGNESPGAAGAVWAGWAGTGRGVLGTGSSAPCPACLAGLVQGKLGARPCSGAVQGAQPVPRAPEEQILGICPLAGPKLVQAGLG